MSFATGKRGHNPDYFFFAVVAILTVFGLAMLASASSNLGKIGFNDTYYYLKHQILYGLSFGAVGFLVGYYLYYGYWKKIAFPALLVSLAALVLVFTPLGLQASSASRWLRLGPLSFQPAELMKLVYLIYLAAWLSNPKLKRATDFQSGFIPFLILSGLIAGLLILQPATSTVVILLASGLVVYFMSGAPIKYLALIAVCAIVVIGARDLCHAVPPRKDHWLP